jgi:hydroxymethylpyrimidine pyrophosphatase-like HAD family hydrolase
MSIVALDLDGTLITYEKIYSIYKRAYEKTIETLKRKNVRIPTELEKHSNEYYRAFREIERFREEFEKIYDEILKENSYLKEEKERAERIYNSIITKFKPRDVYIITGNPKGREIIKNILPEISEEKIFITSEGNYEGEKISLLKRLNIEIYIADLDIDKKIAEEAGVKFLNVKEIEKELFSR